MLLTGTGLSAPCARVSTNYFDQSGENLLKKIHKVCLWLHEP